MGLERNVVLAASADFLLGFGEELWNKFLPKYLEALGAGVLAIGLFGAVKFEEQRRLLVIGEA